MLKILLLSDFSREPERRLLRGLVEYARDHGGCKLYPVTNFIQNDPGKAHIILERAKALKVDAIFGKWPGIDVRAAKELGIPIVLRTNDKDYSEFPMLSGFYEEIGRIAAGYFADQHYRSYAYFGIKNFIWSDRRCNGFKAGLPDNSSFSSYLSSNIEMEWDRIAQWIKSLPRPTALYVCNDVYARTISEICQDIGVNIPDDIALLGTDDDEFLCNISTPSISSLKLDFERQGRELAESILRMVEKGTVTADRIPIRPLSVTERESTARHMIKDPTVRHIVNKIDMEFPTIQSIDTLIKDIPLSKRAVELRFKKEMSPETMQSYLAKIRVKHICTLLLTTELPISAIGEKVGIHDPLYIGKIFHRIIGVTPSEYRKMKSRKM